MPEGGAEGGQRGNLHLPYLGQGKGHECSSVLLEDGPGVAGDREGALDGHVTPLQLHQLLEVQRGEQGMHKVGELRAVGEVEVGEEWAVEARPAEEGVGGLREGQGGHTVEQGQGLAQQLGAEVLLLLL